MTSVSSHFGSSESESFGLNPMSAISPRDDKAQVLSVGAADEFSILLERVGVVDVFCAQINSSECCRMVQDGKFKNQFRVNLGFF